MRISFGRWTCGAHCADSVADARALEPNISGGSGNPVDSTWRLLKASTWEPHPPHIAIRLSSVRAIEKQRWPSFWHFYAAHGQMIPVLFAPFFHLQNPDVSSSRRRHGWCGTEFVIGFCHCVLTVINSISPYSPCFEACLADYSLVPTCLSCSVASLIFARSFLLRQKWTYPVVNMLFYSRYYIPQKHLCKSIRFSFDVGLWIVG